LTYAVFFEVVVAIVVVRLLKLLIGQCMAKGVVVGERIICFFMLLAVGAVMPPRVVAFISRPIISLVDAGGAAALATVVVVPPFLLCLWLSMRVRREAAVSATEAATFSLLGACMMAVLSK